MLRLASFDELAAVVARKRDADTAPHVPEKELQQDGLQLLRHHQRVAWVVRQNTGAGYVLHSHKFRELVAAGHLKPSDARFMRFGFPGAGDVTGQLKGGARLEVEFKSVRGVLTAEQQAVNEAVNEAGGCAIVARSLDDLLQGLDNQR